MSLKFTLFSYHASTCSGELVGTIGPFFDNEPIVADCPRFLAPRLRSLESPRQHYVDNYYGYSDGFFGSAPLKVVPRRGNYVAVVDLSNAFPEYPDGRQYVRSVTLRLRGSTANRGLPARTRPFDPETLTARGGLVEFPLDRASADASARTAFELLTDAQSIGRLQRHPARRLPDGGSVDMYRLLTPQTPLLTERADGGHVEPAEAHVRLDAGSASRPAVHVVQLHAWRFGAPCPGQTITAVVTTSPPRDPRGRLSPSPPATAGLENIPAPVTIPGTGIGRLTLTSQEPPQPPRPGVDGQTYEVALHWGSSVTRHNENYIRSVLVRVFDEVIRPRGEPSWRDVEEILRRYSKLYPYMRRNVAARAPNQGELDLGNETLYRDPQNILQVRGSLELPFDSPGYMPVTRDLSGAKRQLLLDFLAAQERAATTRATS